MKLRMARMHSLLASCRRELPILIHPISSNTLTLVSMDNHPRSPHCDSAPLLVYCLPETCRYQIWSRGKHEHVKVLENCDMLIWTIGQYAPWAYSENCTEYGYNHGISNLWLILIKCAKLSEPFPQLVISVQRLGSSDHFFFTGGPDQMNCSDWLIFVWNDPYTMWW